MALRDEVGIWLKPAGVATLAFAMLASPALALDSSVLDTVQNDLSTAAKSWEATLTRGATSLFWLLAGIEVGLAAIWLAINAANLESWFAELVKRILFIGFFAFVLQQGPDLSKAIVDSLWGIGSGSVSGKLSPADLLDTGMQVNETLNKQIDGLDWTAIAQKLMIAGSGLIVLLTMALFAAVLLAVIVEMYVGLIAGMIMLGLGGSSYTKDFAIRYLVYAFSVGMKLMALSIIAKSGSSILTKLAADAAITTQASGPGMLAAVALVMFALSVFVPNIVQGVVQGVSVGSGMEAIRSGQGTAHYAGMAARTVGGVAAGTFALAVGGIGAGKDAASAATQSGSSPANAVLAGMGAALGQTSGALTGAAADKMSGAPGAGTASTLGLANAKLKENRQTAQNTRATAKGNRT